MKRDTRFPKEMDVIRIYGQAGEINDESAWIALRAEYGIAEGKADFAYNDVFPHDVNFDQTGAVTFPKGCFVGQEVVSRMQHRGTPRRRVLVAKSDTSLPAMATSIMVGGREIGTLGSSSGRIGLALVRIDRVKDALDSGTPILAGENEIRLELPPHVRFTFPAAEPDKA